MGTDTDHDDHSTARPGALQEVLDGVTVDVAVVGGGLAALTAAAVASRAGGRVALFSGAGLGGRARTVTRDGYHFNEGPHALYLAGRAAGVLDALGVAFPGAPPALGNGRLVTADGSLFPLPRGAGGIARSKLFTTREKLRLGRFFVHLRSVDPATLADRSTAAWLAGHDLDGRAALFARTLLRLSTYADDLDALSADAAAAQLRLAGSAGGPGVRYVHGGWQRLVDGLVAVARGAGVIMVEHAPVRSIEAGAGPAGGFLLTHVRDGTGTCRAATVVVAAGGPATARRLLALPDAWGGLGPDVVAATLDLGVRAPEGVGLVLGVDAPLYLSTHCPPADLAPPGGAVVQALSYRAVEGEADRLALEQLAALAGVREDAIVARRFMPTITVAHALPTADNGGMVGRPPVAVAGRAGAFVAGDWVGPEGLLADAAVASGVAAASAALAHARELVGT